MSRPQITNISRYSSEDIWDCIKRLIPATASIESIKIRHLYKPSAVHLKGFAAFSIPVDEDEDGCWVMLKTRGRGRSHLDFALLHPDRLVVAPLEALARSTGAEIAHERIVEELIDAVSSLFVTPNLAIVAKAANPIIRLTGKVDLKQRKLAAFDSFLTKVKSAQKIVATRKRTLAGAIRRRDDEQKYVEKLKQKIPGLEAKQKQLEEELERRRQTLREEGIEP